MVYHLSIFSYSTVLQGLGQSIYPFTRSFYLSIPSICPSLKLQSVVCLSICQYYLSLYIYIHLSVYLSLYFILVLSVILQSYLSLTSICLCLSIYIFVSFICQSVSMSYILSQSYLYLSLSVCVCQYICFCHIFYISLICQSRPSVYISVIYIQSRFYDIPPFFVNI